MKKPEKKCTHAMLVITKQGKIKCLSCGKLAKDFIKPIKL